jgi:hypothetical protein
MPAHKAFRYLRIAFSATCGILCLLLIVLWIRSYWWQDTVIYASSATTGLAIQSWHGTCRQMNYVGALDPYATPAPLGWSRNSLYIGMPPEISFETSPFYKLPSGFFRIGMSYWQVPHWFLFLLSAAFAGVPWIFHRFSLRTLLIAVTLVAVVLGAIQVFIR